MACGRNALDRFARVSRETQDEQIHQVGDIFFALAQGRDIDWNNIQAIVKIFAESAFFERGAQIAVGRGNQPHIDLDRLRSTQPFKLALLQNAQQLHLRRRRHIADLIEKQCSLIGQFEFSRLARGRAGERALFIAKQFAFQ